VNIPDFITYTVVPETERMNVVDQLFGVRYVTLFEPTVFNMAGMLAADYGGAYWEFFSLSNSGFFAAPRGDTIYDVSCPNGFNGKLSANALGLTATMYAYSHLSFGGDAFADLCATQYHLAREYIFSIQKHSQSCRPSIEFLQWRMRRFGGAMGQLSGQRKSCAWAKPGAPARRSGAPQATLFLLRRGCQ